MELADDVLGGACFCFVLHSLPSFSPVSFLRLLRYASLHDTFGKNDRIYAFARAGYIASAVTEQDRVT